MYILAFETTGPVGSVALIDELGNVKEKKTSESMSHLKNITKLSDELLKEEGITPKELTAVAASVGPGSFTGIRIGVTTARGIGQALNIPCIGVSALAPFRRYASSENKAAVIFNARRGQVYGAVYGNQGEEIIAPGPYMLTDILEAVDKYDDLLWFGDGVDAYAKELEGRAFADEKVRYQLAENVAKDAFDMYEKGETLGYEELLPDYMRAAEAETKLKDGTLEKLRAAKLAKFRGR